jgi:hypothetical protein
VATVSAAARVITFRVTQEEYDVIKEIAVETCMSISELCRVRMLPFEEDG